MAETQLEFDAGDGEAGRIDHGHGDGGALRRRHRGAAQKRQSQTQCTQSHHPLRRSPTPGFNTIERPHVRSAEAHAIVETVSSPLNFHLEQYDGPLDLLLDLIRKQQIDIKDIPIATITSQYLQYMDKAREMDLDLGAELVYMAATLIHIKSKMLLPLDPALEEEGDTPDDPRQELVDRLLEHERFKNAAEMLQQKRMIEENVWSNPQIKSFVSEDDDPGLAITLFDLVKAFGEMLERVKNRPVYEVESADVTVADMIRYLRDQFLQVGADQPVFILRIFELQRTRRAMIALFLAVLEMVRMQAVVVTQKDLFGEIALQRHVSFLQVFASQQAMSAIDKDYI